MAGALRNGRRRAVRNGSFPQEMLLANCVIVAAFVAGAAIAARHLSGHSAVAAVGLLVVGGLAVTALVNVALSRHAWNRLSELSSAMESAHKGELRQRVRVDSVDPELRRLALSFNNMCARLEDESRQYAAKLLSSIEDERRRIGRELHDETSQTLAATLVILNLAEKALQSGDLPGAHEHVANSTALIGHSIDEIKLLVYDLRPVMLDDIGLAPTLRWYIQSHLKDAGPTIVTDFEGATSRLPSEVETALYRTTQEMLANAVRHASATKIIVRLETRPGYADLAVIDNGHGFDPDATLHRADRRGLGLLSIKERVELVGGTVNIESTLGRGTRVYVVIPFETEPPSVGKP
jgi:two-component system, NarL family, sensor histidine kinase UhpB